MRARVVFRVVQSNHRCVREFFIIISYSDARSDAMQLADEGDRIGLNWIGLDSKVTRPAGRPTGRDGTGRDGSIGACRTALLRPRRVRAKGCELEGTASAPTRFIAQLNVALSHSSDTKAYRGSSDRTEGERSCPVVSCHVIRVVQCSAEREESARRTRRGAGRRGCHAEVRRVRRRLQLVVAVAVAVARSGGRVGGGQETRVRRAQCAERVAGQKVQVEAGVRTRARRMRREQSGGRLLQRLDWRLRLLLPLERVATRRRVARVRRVGRCSRRRA